MSLKALKDYTFIAKYARYDEEKHRRETWSEAVNRVRDMHLRRYPQIAEEINWAFELVRQKRVLGSQRALQFGGSGVERQNLRGYNCSFSYCDRVRFFQEYLFVLLCGAGAGFSVQKHHIAQLPKLVSFKYNKIQSVFKIDDSIEGWADAIGVLFSSFLNTQDGIFKPYADSDVIFDYSLIRPKGAKLSTSSGKAPGFEPLKQAIDKVKNILRNAQMRDGIIKPIEAYDIAMHLSDCVLSGGHRRSSTIVLFSKDDEEMINAKTGNWFYENPQRARSNNSVMLLKDQTTFEEFKEIFESNRQYGEPGFQWVDSLEYGTNPCSEIGFYARNKNGESGWHLCVAGDTKLITRNGIEYIKDVVSKSIEIWNGDKWCEVQPFITGTHQSLYRVQFNDGSYLDCTDNHKFLVKDRFASYYQELTTKDLFEILPKSKYKIHVPRTTVVYEDGSYQANAYEYGFILGDGNIRKKHNQYYVKASIYGKKSELNLEFSSRGKTKFNEYNTELFDAQFSNLDKNLVYRIKNSDGLPKEIFAWNTESIVEFISGWIDADGSKANKGCRLYGREDRIRDAQLLLSKIGIRSSVNLMQKAGTVTNYGTRNYDIWYLQIVNATKLNSRRLDLSKGVDATKKGKYQIIDSVTKLDGLHTTYCLEEPEKHLCLFNNVLTRQCNLVELNGKKLTDKDKFVEVVKAAAIIGTLQAGYTDFPYLGKVTEEIVRGEALNGISITGIMENTNIICNKEILAEVIEVIRQTNKEIAAKIGINPSARLTAIKPAGTTSCLLGTASGIHPHHARRYLRRVQANELEAPLHYFESINPRAVENSVWSANKTDRVITFCVEVEDGAKTKNDVDALILLEHVKFMKEYWVNAGTNVELCNQPWVRNSVSNTINVKPNEWDDVANYIYENREYFTGISLLPSSGDLDYCQAPFVSVHTLKEIVNIYGDGAAFCSGLIECAMYLWNGNLWLACDNALGFGKIELNQEQINWINKIKLFADKYFGGDLRQTTYCLKEVFNWKLWLDLKREYKDVDYTEMIEEEDNTTLEETLSCSGGSCEIF